MKIFVFFYIFLLIFFLGCVQLQSLPISKVCSSPNNYGNIKECEQNDFGVKFVSTASDGWAYFDSEENLIASCVVYFEVFGEPQQQSQVCHEKIKCEKAISCT